jgi:Flp pilus assembly protein TadB
MLMRKSPPDFWEKMENEANDDLSLLVEVGPSHFSAEHLLELRQELREQIGTFGRRQRLSMLLGATGAAWFLVAVLAILLQWVWLLISAFVAMLFCMGGFTFILLWKKGRPKARLGELEYSLGALEEELRKRSVAYPKRSRDAF